jgi:hypothetical protein
MDAASQKFRDNLRSFRAGSFTTPAVIEAGERPCMIWDISGTGAKLTVGDDEAFPRNSTCCCRATELRAGAAA